MLADMPPVRDLNTAAHLAASLRVPVSRILRAAEGLDLEPTLRIDGIPYFGDTAAQTIAEYLNRTQGSAER